MTECRKCGAEYDKGREPDPCVGMLPSPVISFCCGHGNLDHAIVIFERPLEGMLGRRLLGEAALAWAEAARVR